ncbi:chaperone modulator CbpM [Chitinophagaceae bacterium LB-8]|uniref:Chaperone modulator CbpM n=1 Tax=Paraflavisolibacter caeni TaxID=2982496 RepID=A0A9X3BHI7_9BACT|nr:chaperone modulator CbpM [Paraflavisolibacter caeni]MCU7549712.1 chaperone modulator CbpM [Paraflavisolibacter caeni]
MQDESLIPASELCVHHKIEMSFIYSLQEFGLLEMVNREETIFIPTEQLNELEKLIRMHYELNINMEGIDVICHLLKRIEATQQELNQLRNQLKFFQSFENS